MIENTKKRLEWIDAMRGFTMLMVVANHISGMSFMEDTKTSAAMSLLVLFRMPLFFFVSGFVAYKASFSWSVPDTMKLLWKKIRIQIIPTFIFLCACIVIRHKDFATTFMNAMHSPYKGGYWFTLVLLYMFVCYYVISMLTRTFKYRNAVMVGVWILSIVLYETAFMPKYFHYPKEKFMLTSSLIQLLLYLQFFLCGNLVHRYWTQMQKLFDSKWFFPILTVVAFFTCADFLRWHTMRMMWTNLPRTVAMYATMFVVLIFFRHYEKSFTKDKILGRSLQYVGTRTLDVYLLHYIFMPTMPFVGVWLNAHQPNFVLSVVLSFAMAVIVTGFCLLVSNILRISPLYSEHLFGRRPTT